MPRNMQSTMWEFQPEGPVSLPVNKIKMDAWDSMAESLMTQIDISLGNRSELDGQLDDNNAIYEMRAQDYGASDIPYPGGPNIVVPLVASIVDEFTSRIAGTAILQRPLMVRGNDPVSAQYAHTVEQFYNGEWQKYDWEEAVNTCIHLAGRDGTSFMSVKWKLSTYERVVKANTPMPDGTIAKKNQRIKMIKYDAPELKPVELRDFLFTPNYAKNIDEADMICEKVYLGENDLQALVRADILDEDKVEHALSTVSTAQGDLTYDRQGYSTYTLNNQLNIVDSSVAPPIGINMTRGPIGVWMCHSNQYDLDGDGVAEENIFWVHDRSRTLLGHVPYEYWGGRPYFDYAPFARPNRLLGFSIADRIKGLQAEADLQHLTRLQVLDRILNPTILKMSGAKLAPEDQKLGFNSVIQVPDAIGKNAFTYMESPPYPQESLQEEQYLTQLSERVTGAPQTPGQASPTGGQPAGGSGRTSARQAQTNAAMQGMQTNRVIRRTRSWMLRIFKFIHMLYKQYGKDEMDSVDSSFDGTKKVTIPREILAQDYTLGIAGQGGPLDKESRRQDMQVLFQILMQNPLLQGNLERIWALTQMVLETYEISEVTRLIGTMDEAKQQAQAQQQAQQQQMQAHTIEQVLSHTNIKADNHAQGSNGASAGTPPGAGPKPSV